MTPTGPRIFDLLFEVPVEMLRAKPRRVRKDLQQLRASALEVWCC
jgi:hypothetical protein